MTKVNASIIVMILAAVLPHFGITLGNDALTSVVQGLLEIAVGFYVYFTHKGVVEKARAAGVKGI